MASAYGYAQMGSGYTVGRVETLHKAAEAIGITVSEFLSGIAQAIQKQTGEAVELDA